MLSNPEPSAIRHAIHLSAGHQSDVSVVRWHPNCHYVATASSDRSVRLWDVAGGECVRVLGGLRNGSPTSLAMSPDGKQVRRVRADVVGGPQDVESADDVRDL